MGQQASAPPLPLCEVCGADAERQCGICIEEYLCGKEECFNAAHRSADRKAHRASVGPLGTLGRCSEHADYKLHWMCTEAGCGRALVCIRCQHHGVHAGHSFVDVLYAEAEARENLQQCLTEVASAREAAEKQLADLQDASAAAAEEDLSAELARVCLGLEEAVMRRCAAAAEEVGRVSLQRYCDMLHVGSAIATLSCVAAEGERIRYGGDAQVVTQGPPLCSRATAAISCVPQFVSGQRHMVRADPIFTALRSHRKMVVVPRSSDMLCDLARSLAHGTDMLLDGKRVTGIDICKQALALDPDSSRALRYLARALPDNGSTKLEDGTVMTKEELFKRAISIEPQSSRAFYYLAMSLPMTGSATLEDGTVMTTRQLFKRAIALDPTCSHSFNHLGLSLPANGSTILEDGTVMLRTELFKRAIALDPREMYFKNLASCLGANEMTRMEDGTVMSKAQLMEKRV